MAISGRKWGTHTMRLHHAAVFTLLVAAPLGVTAQGNLGGYEDRIAVEDVISSVRITFPKPVEAVHQSYWQTVRRDKDGRMIAAAMGRSEDRLVKRNGKWLIQWRKLTVFTD